MSPEYPRTNAWEPGIPEDDERERQTVELRDTLRQVQDQLEYGPLHGQYYPISWNIGEIGSNLTHPQSYGRMAFSGVMKPVSLLAIVNNGELTLDIQYWDGSSIVTMLTTPLSGVGTSGARFKDVGDFVVDEIGEPTEIGFLVPTIDSIETPTVQLLNIIVTFKGLSKADYL
jgi:hypothetical protein